MRPLPASVVADPYFRRHPESGPPETGTHVPVLQKGQAKFSRAISQAHFRGAVLFQNLTPGNQGSRGEDADLWRIGGVLKSAVESSTCPAWGPRYVSNTNYNETRSICLYYPWARWASSHFFFILNVRLERTRFRGCSTSVFSQWYQLCHTYAVAAALKALASTSSALHQALTTHKHVMNPRITESYGRVPEILTGHVWTQKVNILLFHHGTTQRH